MYQDLPGITSDQDPLFWGAENHPSLLPGSSRFFCKSRMIIRDFDLGSARLPGLPVTPVGSVTRPGGHRARTP